MHGQGVMLGLFSFWQRGKRNGSQALKSIAFTLV
jgi:hypothetical protein